MLSTCWLLFLHCVVHLIPPSHLLLHASWWEPHMRRSSVHPYRIPQRHSGWNQKSPIWTPDQRTHFHRSNIHCSCFLAQASLLLLLMSFSSGVDVEMCLLLELCETFIWAVISEAGCHALTLESLFISLFG